MVTIDGYTKSLFRKNLTYIILFVVLVLFAALFLPGKLSEYKTGQDKIVVARNEVIALSEKYSALSRYSSEEVEELVQIINKLLPDAYDYFNLYSALDEFQQASGLEFVSLTSPFTSLTAEGAMLSVNAQASNITLLRFLENYATMGGRYATINNITFKPSASSLGFVLTLYAQKAPQSLSVVPKLDMEAISVLKSLAEQTPVQQPVQEFPVESIVGKSNPFLQ